MDNLQTEVLEIEFLSYSKGMPTISEEDFARILLRYTNVDDVSGYMENVRHSIPDEKVGLFFFFCLSSRLTLPVLIHSNLSKVINRVLSSVELHHINQCVLEIIF